MSYKDTRGPGVYRVRRMIEKSERRDDTTGRRDAAILHLLYDLGLRRGEVCKLDLSDVDLAEGTDPVRLALRLPEPDL